MKFSLQSLLAVLMITMGFLHFTVSEPFVRIVPRWLPAPRLLVYLSGFFEIVLGVGLLVPITQSAAAWGLIALYVAVFPANLNMALNRMTFGKLPAWTLWARLPLQLGLIGWAYWYT